MTVAYELSRLVNCSGEACSVDYGLKPSLHQIFDVKVENVVDVRGFRKIT